MTPYESFDPAAKINGESIRTVQAGLRLVHRASELLQRHGLPENPQPGQWYPMQNWLNVLRDVEQEFGPETLYSIGLEVVTHSIFPQAVRTLAQAMHGLDLMYRTNVHGRNMGYYRVISESAQEILLHCRTPNPVRFDLGLITGLARRFKPAEALRVKVDVLPTAPNPADAHLTAYVVRW